jgi:hypothetical protein
MPVEVIVGHAAGPADLRPDTDAFMVHSPWGALAAFFLVQCFGFVTLQGFRMFVNIGLRGADQLNTIFVVNGRSDRMLLPLWGLVWILVFVVFQTVILRRISHYLSSEGPRALWSALRRPGEAVKLALAMLFAYGYVRCLLGHYPFPSRTISFWMSTAFGAFSWVVSGLIVWLSKHGQVSPQSPVGTANTIGGALSGFLIGGLFVWLALVKMPGLFYFHGMLGLLCITMCACQLLFLSRPKPGRSDQLPAATP